MPTSSCSCSFRKYLLARHSPRNLLEVATAWLTLSANVISFTGQVRLHSILLRTSATESAPKTLKVFLNRDDLDFGTASDMPPTQTLELSQTNDIQELPVKRALFNTTRSLALFFEDNFSQGEEDVTRISYLAFKGEFMRLNKEPINFLYEAAANPSDHKVKGTSALGMGSGIGGPGGGGGDGI